MIRRALIFSGAFLVACNFTLAAEKPSKPNVMFILAARLDEILADTQAVIPKANPAYHPVAKESKHGAPATP